MTRLLLGVFAIMISGIAIGAPFAVSDPLDMRATHCGFSTDGKARVDVPVALSGTAKICKLDLDGIATGSHTINATAVAVDAAWGRLESAPSATFTFSVPTTPAVPSGLKLAP